MEQIAESVIKNLIATHSRIAVAESCTGGMLATALTAVPGSSACFDYGVVSYSNESKTALLGVGEDILRLHGAVSEQTAAAMASGVAAIGHTDMALATTGIAGPSGGSAEKPVGLVYIACYVRGRIFVDRCHFSGDREQVRRQTVAYALTMALKQVTGEK